MGEQVRKKVIFEYEMLRVIVTLLVIVGHCAYYTIITEYGGCDYRSEASQLSVTYKLADLLTSMIYSFHMQLFMTLSGALFCLSLQRGKFHTLRSLASEKAKRLLIPFFSVTLLYSVPLKIASGYYSSSPSIIKDIIIGQLLVQGNTHLWFVAVLFSLFLLMYVLLKKKVPCMILLLILTVLNLVSSYIGINLISRILEFAVWFYIGWLFEQHREVWNSYLKKHHIFLFMAVFCVFFFLNRNMLPNISILKSCVKLLIALSGCVAVYTLSYQLSRTDVKEWKVVKGLSHDSYGIYLYSDPLNYVLLAVGVHMLHTDLFGSNICSALFILTRFSVTLAVSILVTRILRALKLKYLV